MKARKQIYLIPLALYLVLLAVSGLYISASSPIWGWDSLDFWMPRAYEYFGDGQLSERHRHGTTLPALYYQLTSLLHPLLTSSQSISVMVLVAALLTLIIITRLFVMLRIGVWAGLALGCLLLSMPLAENLRLSIGYSEVFCSFVLLSAVAFMLESAVKPSFASVMYTAVAIFILASLRNTGLVYAATTILSGAIYIIWSRVRKKRAWTFYFCASATVFVLLFVDVSAGHQRVTFQNFIVTVDRNEIWMETKNGCRDAFVNKGLQARLYPTDPSSLRAQYGRDYMPVPVNIYDNGFARINYPGYTLKKVWLKIPKSLCSEAHEGSVYFPDLTVSSFANSIMIFSDGTLVIKALGYHLNVEFQNERAVLSAIATAFIANMSISISLLPVIFASALYVFHGWRSWNYIQVFQLSFFISSIAAVILALWALPYFYKHSAPGEDTLFSRVALPFLQANLLLSMACLWSSICKKSTTA